MLKAVFRRKPQPANHEQQQAQKIAQLTASRRAIADAYEVERARIERDLHDGAQQYLVAASMKLGEALLDAPLASPSSSPPQSRTWTAA